MHKQRLPHHPQLNQSLNHFELVTLLSSLRLLPFFLQYCVLANESNKRNYRLKKKDLPIQYIPHLCCPKCAGSSEGAIQLIVSPERPILCKWGGGKPKKLAQDGTPCCLTQVLIWEDYKHSSVITGCCVWWHWLQWDEEMHVLQVDWKGIRSEKAHLTAHNVDS